MKKCCCCGEGAGGEGTRGAAVVHFFRETATPYFRLALSMYLNIGCVRNCAHCVFVFAVLLTFSTAPRNSNASLNQPKQRYAYITMTALESVDCVPTRSAGDDGALYLERRPETLCWAGAGDSASLSAAHWPLGVLAAVVLTAYSVGYPLASLLFIYCQFFHKQNAAPSVLERQAIDR